MDREIEQTLAELTGAIKTVGERQVSLEDRIKKVEEMPLTDSSESTAAEKEKGTTLTDSSKSTARLQELEAEVAELHHRAEVYESPAYASEMISQWAHGLTFEDYVALGAKLGFQDALAEEEGQNPDLLEDVNLDGGPRITFSEAVPEGEAGWMKSEFLGCFVKVES